MRTQRNSCISIGNIVRNDENLNILYGILHYHDINRETINDLKESVDRGMFTNFIVLIESIIPALARKGDLRSIIWLVNTYKQIEIERIDEKALKEAAYTDQFHVMEWLIQNYSTDIHTGYDKIFRDAVINREMKLLDWLMKNYASSIDVHALDEYVFQVSALWGKLDMMIWLIENFPDIDIHCRDERAFRLAVEWGRFKVVKWLIELSEINIYIRDFIAFRKAARNKHLDILLFLFKVSNYNMKILEYGEIKRYEEELLLSMTRNRKKSAYK